MDFKNLVILISKLRDLDKSAEFASEIEILETAIKNTDERGYELIQDDYNRLAQKIENAIAVEKKERNRYERG